MVQLEFSLNLSNKKGCAKTCKREFKNISRKIKLCTYITKQNNNNVIKFTKTNNFDETQF